MQVRISVFSSPSSSASSSSTASPSSSSSSAISPASISSSSSAISPASSSSAASSSDSSAASPDISSPSAASSSINSPIRVIEADAKPAVLVAVAVRINELPSSTPTLTLLFPRDFTLSSSPNSISGPGVPVTMASIL